MKFFYFCISISSIHGFLLDSKNSSVVGKQTFLTVSEYYGDKTQVEHEFERVREEQYTQKRSLERNLNLLAQQIQDKLDAFEQKLQVNTATNDRQVLEQKIQILEQKYAEMRNSSDTWRQKYNDLDIKITQVEQDNTLLHQTLGSLNHTVTMVMEENNQLFTENKRLQNLTMELQQKVVGLEHLKGVNQLQALSEVQQKTQTLDNRVTVLANTQQARSQDFMALYNKVNSLESLENSTRTTMSQRFQEIEHKYSESIRKTENDQNRSLNEFENQTKIDIDKLEVLTNQSLNMIHKIADDLSQKVVLSACHTANEYVDAGVMKFPYVKTAVGINDLYAYQRTGKFQCTVPGYYFVLATTESLEDRASLNIMLNSKSQYEHYITDEAHGNWFPGTIALTLKLETSDQVWIELRGRYGLYRSCFNLFKIS